MKPFRFGVIARRAGSWSEWADKARKVEDLGFSVMAVPDHLTDMLAPMPAVVSAAAATRTLRVGTAVLNNDLRHPVLVAREAATADVLTGGRLELGLGAGHMKSEYDEAGLTFDPGPTRVERLAEAVAIIRRLLDGERVTFSGRHYQVTSHAVHPRPVQQPHPPLFIGGNAASVLALAAREADIIGLTGIAFRRGGAVLDVSAWRAASVDAQMRVMREAAGDRHGRLEVNALVQRVVVTDDRRKAADELSGRWPQLSPEEILATPYALIGSVDEMVDDLHARRERWGISYYLIHEPNLHDLAPVVARLAGR